MVYQLRWLFYRRIPNLKFGSNSYKSDKRCSKCKGGSDGLKWMFPQYGIVCPHCHKKLVEEPNASVKHRAWKLWTKSCKLFWNVLDWLHIVRSSIEGRYDIFGDEMHYVEGYTIDMESGKVTTKMKKRKWWEYIVIKKK